LRRLTYLRSASQDLIGIQDYLTRESGSLASATGFVSRLRAQCAKLAGLPGTLGQARPELHPEIRSTSFRGYVIFFRYRGDRLEIVNILEGHRDIEAHFEERPPLDS
jgi:plasmid stabilization system protein ParE